MGKPLTRLTLHVSRKKKEGNLLLSFVSGFMHVHAHAYIFFSGMGNCALALPGGGCSLDKPPGYRHKRRGESP